MKNILGRMNVGDVVSFDLHVEAMVTQSYHRVKVLAVIPAKFSDKFGEDVYTLHAQIYRLLPPGTIQDDPESYQYIVVELEDGQNRVVGLPWIKDDTIRVHDSSTVTFTVEDMPQEDINDVRDYFARKGYQVNVNVVSS